MTARFATDDEKWAACVARDHDADGAFLIAVLTTKIYCRPICPGRPLRKNVRFAATPAEAVALGCRACLRCKPPS